MFHIFKRIPEGLIHVRLAFSRPCNRRCKTVWLPSRSCSSSMPWCSRRREAARSGAGSDWRGFATSKDRGFHRHGGTPKWMVLRGNPIKMDDLGVPLYGNTHIGTQEKQTTCSECHWMSSHEDFWLLKTRGLQHETYGDTWLKYVGGQPGGDHSPVEVGRNPKNDSQLANWWRGHLDLIPYNIWCI